MGDRTDAATELLAQVQHDLGEGPYLQAYAQDRAIVVEDLRVAAAWTRIDAVVGQLNVRGMLSVPIRLQGQPTASPTNGTGLSATRTDLGTLRAGLEGRLECGR